MVKSKPGWRILTVNMPEEERTALLKMADGRKWRKFFKDIQDDARKRAEITQGLRDSLALKEQQLKTLDSQLESASSEIRRLCEKYGEEVPP